MPSALLSCTLRLLPCTLRLLPLCLIPKAEQGIACALKLWPRP